MRGWPSRALEGPRDSDKGKAQAEATGRSRQCDPLMPTHRSRPCRRLLRRSSSSLVLITAGTLRCSTAGSYRAAITRYRDAPMITEILCFHSARHLWHRCLIVHSLIKRRYLLVKQRLNGDIAEASFLNSLGSLVLHPGYRIPTRSEVPSVSSRDDENRKLASRDVHVR